MYSKYRFLTLFVLGLFLVSYTSAAPSGKLSPRLPLSSVQDTDRFIGTYRREFIGASGRVVELIDLKADLTATMSGEYENRGNVIRSGNWTWARNRLIVTFAPIDIGGTPLVLEFSRTGGGWFRTGNNLKLQSSTPSGFAAKGIVYQRIRRG